MPKIKKRIKIVEMNLNKQKDLGQAEPTGSDKYVIRIHDHHKTEKSRLNTVVHEALHCADFDMSERKVRQLTTVIVDVLWRQKYRRVLIKSG
jgi:hypothetical protein